MTLYKGRMENEVVLSFKDGDGNKVFATRSLGEAETANE